MVGLVMMTVGMVGTIAAFAVDDHTTGRWSTTSWGVRLGGRNPGGGFLGAIERLQPPVDGLARRREDELFNGFGLNTAGIHPSRRINVPVYLSILDGEHIAGRGLDAIRSQLHSTTNLHVIRGVRGTVEGASVNEHAQALRLLANGVDSLPTPKRSTSFLPTPDEFTQVGAGAKLEQWAAVGCTLSHLKMVAQAFLNGEEVGTRPTDLQTDRQTDRRMSILAWCE